MDVTKAPPVDPSAERGPASPPQQQLSLPLTAAATLDRVDIQPLDLVGALLILIAEVRAGLPTVGAPAFGMPVAGPAALGAPNPSQTPPSLIRLFLAALPEEALLDQAAPDDSAAAWAATAAQLEAALAAALDKGVAAVTAWRDVAPSVVATVEDARAVVLAVLGGESVNAEWLRPEWLGLAPRLERYWRRRRRGRRGLSNPDHERRDDRDDRDDERGTS